MTRLPPRSSALLGFVMLVGCGGDDGSTTIYGSSTAYTYTNGDPSGAEMSTSTDSSGNTTDPSTTDPSTTDPSTTDPSTTDPSTTDGQPCGNGIIDQGEQCDGSDLGGQDCTSLGYAGGTLACDAAICIFDTSACIADTGDGGNQCDQYCGGCTCPSAECTMCCAGLGKIDTCGGGMCGCF